MGRFIHRNQKLNMTCEMCNGTLIVPKITHIEGGGNIPPEGYDEVETQPCPFCTEVAVPEGEEFKNDNLKNNE